MTTAMIKSENGSNAAIANCQAPRSWASAPVDVFEGEGEFLVYADVPGSKQQDINVQYVDGELRLEATRNLEARCHWPTDYKRVFAVGPDVDVDNIHAELKDGVLTIRLPKLAAARPRQIAIQAG